MKPPHIASSKLKSSRFIQRQWVLLTVGILAAIASTFVLFGNNIPTADAERTFDQTHYIPNTNTDIGLGSEKIVTLLTSLTTFELGKF